MIGPYRLVGQLGEGGMGRVFLGRSAGGRSVAVKVIRSQVAAEPDFRVRFRREVAAARKVSGLFTATVVDADVDAPEPWLATAYVAGPSLSEAVHDHGPLPLDSVLALAAGLAESLAAIHAAGVVHRDLKPANVLLSKNGPCVIDFGISRAAEATSLTRAGFVIGSPGFMSPEQAEGTEVGPPSDIFSLGAVLAFAASGQPPFGSGMTAALVYRIVHKPPRLDGVPEEIRPLIERCLAKDSSQRPAATELLTEVEAVQPTDGWLPEPITRTFQDSSAYPTPQPPGSVIAAGEPPADPPTITGQAALVTPGPETFPPAEAEPAEPQAQVPAAEPPAEEPGTAAPQAEAAAPQTAAVIPGLGAALDAAVTGEFPAEPEPEPEPASVIVPVADGDLPGRPPRRRLGRRAVLASAAAMILVASVATGLALSSGPSHASASRDKTTPTSSALADLPSAASQPSASTSAPHASASSSPRPRAQQSTPGATTQPPATAPGSVPSSSRSTPKASVKPTPKPTPKRTPPAALSVSVSGGSELSCGSVGSLRSSSGASVQFGFVDHSSSDIQIAYIDSSGALVNEATLVAGSSGGYTTAVGDYWVIENSGGGCLAVIAINGGGQAVVS